MDGLSTLLILSIVMALASFIAGLLILSLKLSQSPIELLILRLEWVSSWEPRWWSSFQKVSNPSTVLGGRHGGILIQNDTYCPECRYSLGARRLSPSCPGSCSSRPGLKTNPFNVPGPVIPSKLIDPPRTPTNPGVVGIMDTGNGKTSSNGEEDAEKHSE